MPRLSDQLWFRGRHERIPADDDHALSIPLGNTEQIGHLDSSTNTCDVGNAGDNRNQSTIDLEANLDVNSDADTNNSPAEASDSNAASTANQTLTLPSLIIINTIMVICAMTSKSEGLTIALSIIIFIGMYPLIILGVISFHVPSNDTLHGFRLEGGLRRRLNDVGHRRMSIICAGVLFLMWISEIIMAPEDMDKEDRIRDIPRMTLSFFLFEGGMVCMILTFQRIFICLASGAAQRRRRREQTRQDSRTTIVAVATLDKSQSSSFSYMDAKVGHLPLLPFGANNLQVADAVQAYELESSAQRDSSLDDHNAGVNGGINHPTRFHQQQIAFSACESCSICITDFTMGEMVCLLPQCGHAYHSECVRKWLVDQKSAYCPLCQARVLI